MRVSTIAIVAVLAVAVSGPALGQKSKKRAAAVDRYEQCESQAIAQGLTHGQAGHTEYVRECMGKRPGNSNVGGAGSQR
jgi:type II secretory pathway pseudopilin PulG